MADQLIVPNDMRAEQALLGCWLSEPKGKWYITAHVTDDEFYYSEHVTIASVIGKMVGAGERIDVVTVGSRLRENGRLDSVGGLPYLQQLIDSVPTTINAEYYAGIVRELAHVRAMILASRDAYELGVSARPDAREMENILANSLIRKESGTEQSATEVCSSLLTTMANTDHGVRVPNTRLRGVDGLLHGLYPGSMYTIAARMSVGKSALLFWIGMQSALQGFPVQIISVEMKPELVAWRMVSAMSGVNAIRYFTGDMDTQEWDRVVRANQRLAELPIWFVRSKRTVDDVCLAIRRAKTIHNIAVAGVDYLQMLHDKGHESRTSELDSISGKLKALAEELDIALIAVVAANRRSVTEHSGVSISDMRGSDGIAYDTDVAILLNEDATAIGLPEDVHKIEVTVAKNRNGRQGECIQYFDRRYQRFMDEEPETGGANG